MDLDDLTEELNIRTGDSDDFTFTPEEKTSALTQAFNDAYVVHTVWNTTLTYTVGTYQYALPSGVTTIKDVYIKPDNSQEEPAKIDSKLWEVVGSYLQFKTGSTIIPSGYRLYLKSNYKYTSANTITETALQEYVLALALVKLYTQLLTKKTFRFLKNDTSVSEIVAAKREAENTVRETRQRLPREFELA